MWQSKIKHSDSDGVWKKILREANSPLCKRLGKNISGKAEQNIKTPNRGMYVFPE